MKSMVVENEEVYADPTYDVTFKMLFGSDKNKVLLVSFLNNILSFKGKDEIKDLNIINSSLIQEDLDAIESAVDVRCRTASGEDISIEMQRRNEDYFLARTQDYMGKLISSQVNKDEGKKYHLVMNKTYIVIISKAKLFIKDNKIEGDYDILYEKTIVPMVKELNQEVPHNKMFWKFFELPKFEKFAKDKDINAGSSLKEQWLNFLINCHGQKVMPENISDIIKAGYEIMKIAKWSKEDKENYELSKIKEAYKLKELESIEENAFKEGMYKGEIKGKWKGEVKGEITQFKNFQKLKLKEEQYNDMFKYLKKDNFPYIQEHIDETESQIMGGMDIEYQNDI